MYEQLTALYNSNEYPMHMPGHKRQTGFYQPFDAVKIDITEIPGYDDLYSPDGIIKEALDRASALYDTKDTFFLVNGSTVGILTAVYALTRQHGRILMARNCHKSVYHAAELRELSIEYIVPEFNAGIYDAIDPKAVEHMLSSNRYDAVVITSPTYEGIVSDIEKIADICHGSDTPLIVDEAHGAHFGFHERFPQSAVKYADIVIQSTHKTLPTLTQTGLLHIGKRALDSISRKEVLKYLQMFQTSSPSYVLMCSIDSCIKRIEESGDNLWKDFFIYRDEFDKSIKDMRYLKLIKTDDPCKIIISTKDSSIYATKLADILLNEYHIQLEMASAAYIVAIVTCCDTKEGFGRFEKALLDIDKRLTDNKKHDGDTDRYMYLLHTKAQDNIYIYPPGIPIVAKGESIDEKALDTIALYEAAGLKIRGL